MRRTISSTRSRKRALLGALAFGLTASLGLAAPLTATADPQVDPAAVDDVFMVKTGEATTVYVEDLYLNDTDASGNRAYIYTSGATEGTVQSFTKNGYLDRFVYTPKAGYTGAGIITYDFQDAEGKYSDKADIVFNIAVPGVVPNRPPRAHKDTYTVKSGTVLNVGILNGVFGNDIDADSDSLTIVANSVPQPNHGVLAMDANKFGGFVYTPTFNYVGTDTFSYRGEDPSNAFSNVTTVTITVTPPDPIVTKVAFTKLTGGPAGGTGSVTAQITSSNSSKAGANIKLALEQNGLSTPLAEGITNANGAVTFTFPLPKTQGSYVLSLFEPKSNLAVVGKVTVTAQPIVNSIVLGVPAGKPGKGVYLAGRIGSANIYRAGAPVTAYLDGKKVTSRVSDSTGSVKIPVKLPTLAGKHSIKIVSGSKSATKNFTYGKGVTAKLAKLKTVKTKKTQTIKGSFGTKSGKITLKITDPKGKTATKIVTLNSKGKFTYKYKVSSVKGTWTVRYSYRANTKYYGTKNYKLTFKVK